MRAALLVLFAFAAAAQSPQPARVFDPNPVAAINDPSLMDENDSATAVPDRAYSVATVDLLGPHVRIIDRQPPTTTQPDPNAPLVFDRGDDRFEAVNAAFHIDRMQRHLQSLGYLGARQLVPYAIEVDPLAATNADASFFLPSTTRPGYGTLFYGSGGTDDAEDADLVVHEYGHAILEWIAPGTFTGTFASEARALSEGIGDYLAFSAHYEQRVASGRDPFCFADWDARCWTDAASEGCAYPAGSDCLRRLDSPRTMLDYDRSESGGVEHRNGQIWSSALREIFLKLGRRTTDILVIESMIGVSPHPTYAVLARRMLATDQLLYGGAHRDAICAAMTSRGIIGSCDGSPRGELTLVQSGDRSVPIPDLDPNGIVSRITVTEGRAIERIGVRVDIDHSARGDLRIELVAPDGTRVLLQNASFDLTPDIHATYGIDAATAESLDVLRGRSVAGTWELRVADTRARDAGTLLSWGLVLQLTGDAPLATRPRAGKVQMIPVVAHLFGAHGTSYASDVRLANLTIATQVPILIFTRSGEDGSRDFRAVSVTIGPGQTVALNDVVASTFLTTGSGSLEILGDVVVMSRTYDASGAGSQIPANLETIVRGDFPMYATGLPFTQNDRFNVGVTEVGGGSGVVRIDAGDRRISTHAIAPYSHFQFAVPGPYAGIQVIEGDARVAGYVSQAGNTNGDAMFIPALRQRPRRVVAPAISAAGWTTDLWLPVPNPAFPFIIGLNYTTGGVTEESLILDEVHFDAVATSWEKPGTAGTIEFSIGSSEMFAHSRITNGRTSQYVPFLPEFSGEQHLVFIENDGGHRTNIGFASTSAAFAEAIVYDAAGREIERHILGTPGGIAQVPVRAAVSNGRAVVRFLAGSGRAYASMIDKASGDATFVPGQ